MRVSGVILTFYLPSYAMIMQFFHIIRGLHSAELEPRFASESIVLFCTFSYYSMPIYHISTCWPCVSIGHFSIATKHQNGYLATTIFEGSFISNQSALVTLHRDLYRKHCYML